MRGPLTALTAVLLVTSGLAGVVAADTGDHVGFVYEGDELVLHNGPGQNVTGQTDLKPGTVVRVRVASTSAEQPFLTRPEAVVRDDGSFTTNFSLDTLDATTSVELTAVVSATGETIDEETAVVRPCNGACPDETIRSGPEDEPTATSDVPGGDLLERDVVTVAQGKTARIPVVLDGASEVTVAIGSDDVNYRINATVRDGDGDGRVALLFNTTAAGHEPPTLSVVNGGDSVTVTDDENWLGSMLDPVGYDLRLYRGDPTGEPDTVGALQVRASDENVPDDPEFVGERPRSFEFEDAIVTTYRGEVAGTNVSLVDAETATVTLTNDRYGVAMNATLRDGDGDGRIPIRFDTAVGSTDDPIRPTQDADALVDATMTRGNATATLPPGEYGLTLYRGEQTDEKIDIGVLIVREYAGHDSRTGDSATGSGEGATTATNSGDAGTDPATATGTADVESTGEALLVGGGAVGLLAVFGVAVRLFA